VTTLLSLADGVPESLSGLPALYLLGVGGPEDESGIGKVETFVWRFAVIERAGADVVALAFTRMPALMAFTRALNGRQPFTVPTEALRIAGAGLRAAPIDVLLDGAAEDYDALVAAGGRLEERRLPALEGSGA
jgi:hypothetical protein